MMGVRICASGTDPYGVAEREDFAAKPAKASVGGARSRASGGVVTSIAPMDRTKDSLAVAGVRRELLRLRGRMTRAAAATVVSRVPRSRRASLENLLHYLTLRAQDLRHLHDPLARLGLSSLGRSESHVLANVDAVLANLGRMLGEPVRVGASGVTLDEGRRILEDAAQRLLGPTRSGRRTRIMVTLPQEAARDQGLLVRLLRGGMDAARINCAHDRPADWRAMIGHLRAAERRLGRRPGSCRVIMDLAGPKVRTGAMSDALVVRPGDEVVLTTGRGADGRAGTGPRVICTLSAALSALRVDAPVWFDDGKIGAAVVRVGRGWARVRIERADPEGSKIRADKGINMPETEILTASLSRTDLEHLRFVTRHADGVAMSFVRTPRDVATLRRALKRLGRADLPVVLKIETREGFANLPGLLTEAMRCASAGVMIARGDLAVEVGYERLAEVQEQVLWLCEAAHMPVIWATQVLEQLAKKGRASRAEVTDAAMSQRAECVMLNKGPYIDRAVATLDDIIRRMQGHANKKTPVMRKLRLASGYAAVAGRDHG